MSNNSSQSSSTSSAVGGEQLNKQGDDEETNNQETGPEIEHEVEAAEPEQSTTPILAPSSPTNSTTSTTTTSSLVVDSIELILQPCTTEPLNPGGGYSGGGEGSDNINLVRVTDISSNLDFYQLSNMDDEGRGEGEGEGGYYRRSVGGDEGGGLSEYDQEDDDEEDDFSTVSEKRSVQTQTIETATNLWKSELDLGKYSRIGSMGGSAGGGGGIGFGGSGGGGGGGSGRPSVACRVDVGSSVGNFNAVVAQSQLYRTRNLSRNLHLTESEMDSNWKRPPVAPSTSSTSWSRQHFKTSTSRFVPQSQRRRSRTRAAALLAKSLPNLHKQISSSSGDETSELIDETEASLRASIDLLLKDEFSPRHWNYEYKRNVRFRSEPELMTRGRISNVGKTPFLPRRISDLRTCDTAKVILPSGDIGVVRILSMDEMSELLQVDFESKILVLPFRKVVFAWK